MRSLPLRRLTACLTTALTLLVVAWASSKQSDEPSKEEPIAFFLVGDTHILADKLDPTKLDARSDALTNRLIDVLNRLPGTEIPKEAGGGSVRDARGLIHAGDCIDTGDQANVKMQQREWDAFVDAYGLTGRDGKLKMPVYEVHGNHDGPRGDTLAVKGIIERNKKRPHVANLSKNGLHYSWDWGNVHFVNLGIVVGQGDGVTKRRRYDPHGSLEFLIADLKEKVGDSGRPIVITHHVDMLRYAEKVDEKKAAGREWDSADVQAFHEAIKGYNVAAILFGHTHGRNVFRWDGSGKAAKEGIPVFNVSKSSHYSGLKQALFYIEIRGDSVTAREYQTNDGWQTGFWTKQVWTAPMHVLLRCGGTPIH